MNIYRRITNKDEPGDSWNYRLINIDGVYIWKFAPEIHEDFPAIHMGLERGCNIHGFLDTLIPFKEGDLCE